MAGKTKLVNSAKGFTNSNHLDDSAVESSMAFVRESPLRSKIFFAIGDGIAVSEIVDNFGMREEQVLFILRELNDEGLVSFGCKDGSNTTLVYLMAKGRKLNAWMLSANEPTLEIAKGAKPFPVGIGRRTGAI